MDRTSEPHKARRSPVKHRAKTKRAKEIERLAGALAESKVETKRLTGELEAARSALSERDVGIEKLSGTLSEREAEVARLGDAVKAAEQALSERAARISELEGALTERRMETERLTGELEARAAQISKLESTLSWRLTVLFRHASTAISGLAKRIPFHGLAWPFSADGMSHKSNYASINLLVRNRTEAQEILNGSIPHRAAQIFTYPNLDISVVTHNNEKWLDGFFASIDVQTYPPDKIALYFCDNASTDETAGRLRRWMRENANAYRHVSLQIQRNVGFGRAHNRNFRECTAPFILVTNVDLEFEKDALTNVVTFASRDRPNVASWELRQKPYEHPKYYDPVTLETVWSSHSCVLLRADALKQVKGYEPAFFMYGEDVELSYRLRDAGYRLRYCPFAVVWHYSYKHAGECKPLQFAGSVFANAFIRLRFGTWRDIKQIVPMYISLFFRPPHLAGVRRVVAKNAMRLIARLPHILATRKKSALPFPFWRWDYESIRDGAFYEHQRVSTFDGPKVSIVVRTHGSQEGRLAECLCSILNQTYPNLELVVVEDGGNEAAALVNRALAASRLVGCYRSLPKRGRSHTGNIGLALASGELLMFLDYDDLLFSDHVEILVQELQRNPSVDGAYALSWEVQARPCKESPVGYEEVLHSTPKGLRQPFDRDILYHHNYIPIQALLFRRHLYERYGGFDESLICLEDWDLWTRYADEHDFVHVEKTTSLFHVPWEPREMQKRQELFDVAYPIVKQKQLDSRAGLRSIATFAGSASEHTTQETV